MSWLVNRAFLITPQTIGKKDVSASTMRNNRSILLKTLYTVNPSSLLEVFSKNV